MTDMRPTRGACTRRFWSADSAGFMKFAKRRQNAGLPSRQLLWWPGNDQPGQVGGHRTQRDAARSTILAIRICRAPGRRNTLQGRSGPTTDPSCGRRRAREAQRPLGPTTAQPQPAANGRIRPDTTGLAQDQPLTALTQVRGHLCRWWQVLGSNQRRLSRRFYSEPIPTHRNSR